VLAVILLDLHVLLAPWTVQKTEEFKKGWAERKARQNSAAYLAALHSMPAIPLQNFLAFTTAFRDHLRQQGIKLTVVMWPQPEALMEKPGMPQLKPGPAGAVMFQAAKALRREHVKVIETLREIHEHLCLRPEDAGFLPDGHLGLSILKVGTDQIIRDLDPKLITRNGRGFLIAGDSYSNILHMAFLKRPELAEARVFWRGSGAQLVPYEIASLKSSGLQGIHQLIWVIPSQYLLHDQNPSSFPSLAASLARRMPEVPGQRTIQAVVEELPTIPEALGKSSPYPDALMQCRFHEMNGGEFLGLVSIMHQRTAGSESGAVGHCTQSFTRVAAPADFGLHAELYPTPLLHHVVGDISTVNLDADA
jgi:hypothetical protein